MKQEQQQFINPFSIASRHDSDNDSENEVTAEGFFKKPDDTKQSKQADEKTNEHGQRPVNRNSGANLAAANQLSPFDVLI